jgi:hypothetical protein
MKVAENIKESIAAGQFAIDVARKVFLSYQSQAFMGRENIEYEIKNSIKDHLKIPFICIHVAGSAKTGFSFFKHTLFTEGKSDLDISIISLELYNKFLEIAHKKTAGFTDLSTLCLIAKRKTNGLIFFGINQMIITKYSKT